MGTGTRHGRCRGRIAAETAHQAVAKFLSGSGSGAGELLSIVGVNPSVILGTQMKGSLTVAAGGDYAGGLVGEGSGTVIGDSSQNRLQNLTFWKYNNPRDFPQQRSTTIEGLESVTATLLRGWHRRQSATDNGSWVAQQCGENWRYRHAQEVRPVCRVHRGEHVCHRSGIRFDGDGRFILCGRCHRMRHRW